MRLWCRWMLSGLGFVITSCWRISFVWSFGGRWRRRLRGCTVGLRGGLPTMATSSRRCDTRSPPGTGPTQPGWSQTTRSGGCSTAKRERSSAVLRAFPEGASVDHPDLALAHAADELNQGRLEDAAAQLALAESHVESAPPARRRRLAMAIASLRLALARRSGHFTEVVEQVDLLDASISDESNEQIPMGSELRGVALLNLGIVETWSGRFDDAERHLFEGAALARTIGRPYLEVSCRAHQRFPSKLVSLATARERGRQAVALAERHGLDDRPMLAARTRGGWRVGDLDG